jgi:hypothetical protein
LPSVTDVPTDADLLSELIDDARHLPAPLLPRPRQPEPPAFVDLTEHEIRIPEATASLLDGLDDYGA